MTCIPRPPADAGDFRSREVPAGGSCRGLLRLLLAALFGVLLASTFAATGEVTVRQYRTSNSAPGKWPRAILGRPRTGPTAFNEAIRFQSGTKSVTIKYAGYAATPEDGGFKGEFGWPDPKANWYQNNFFRVTVNGETSEKYRFNLLETRAGEAGYARYVAALPAAKVIVEFSLRAGDDKLLLTVRLVPGENQKLNSATVYFLCYPSKYAKKFPETRKRMIVTAQRELRPGESQAALTEPAPWILFLDQHYDAGQRRGTGPCALAWDVSRSNMRLRCGDYACHAEASLRPGIRKVSFLLWDLSGLANADALSYMKSLQIKPLPGAEEPKLPPPGPAGNDAPAGAATGAKQSARPVTPPAGAAVLRARLVARARGGTKTSNLQRRIWRFHSSQFARPFPSGNEGMPPSNLFEGVRERLVFRPGQTSLSMAPGGNSPFLAGNRLSLSHDLESWCCPKAE